MADIRIKDLPETLDVSADDYVAVDNAGDGTRKFTLRQLVASVGAPEFVVNVNASGEADKTLSEIMAAIANGYVPVVFYDDGYYQLAETTETAVTFTKCSGPSEMSEILIMEGSTRIETNTLTSNNITNNSDVAGNTVSEALDELSYSVTNLSEDISDVQFSVDDHENTISSLDTRVTALESGGGGGGTGLTQTEKNLILALFSKAAYAESDASTAYDTLEELWTTVTRTITYNLSNVVSSNTQTSIDNGQVYTTAFGVRQGYTLNSVTVAMGGVDITSTAYSSGTVSIPSVTGNIVITATAVPSTSDTTAQIATEGYVSEHIGTGTSASNYRQTAKTYGGITIKYQLDESTTSLQLAGIIPFADSTITKGVGCLIIYDSTDTIVNHLDEQSNTSPNRWAQLATGTLTEFVSSLYTVGTYSQITFSVDTRYLDDAYMYDYVTGQVFFAGENTPYYGMHNISEASA